MATSTIKQFDGIKLNTTPVANANTANTSKIPLLFKTNSNSLNTPYKQGLTTASDAYILDLQDDKSYNTQYAFCVADRNLYGRTKIPSSGWSSWARKTKNFTNSGTVTMVTGTSNIRVKQFENVVQIEGWISNATLTANEETLLANISGVSMPANTVRAICNVGANADTIETLSYISFTTNGKLKVTSSNGGSGKAIFFNFTYVVN